MFFDIQTKLKGKEFMTGDINGDITLKMIDRYFLKQLIFINFKSTFDKKIQNIE